MFTPTNRALSTSTGRDFARNVATALQRPSPSAPLVCDAPAHQGRGNAALYELARVQRLALRELVDPEMEPGPEFDINADTPDHEMEPLDPSIESSIGRVTVTGDEDSVTITAEDGETIVSVTDEGGGEIGVDVEDTADVLLAAKPQQRVIVEGDDTQVTITAEEGETLIADEVDGAVIVEVDEP